MRIGWGFECWQFGMNEIDIVIGDGRDIKVSRIQGFVSAARIGVALDPNYLRQTLVTITYENPWGSYTGSANEYPFSDRKINEVNGNLLAVNVKQCGDQCVHIPVDLVLAEPQLCQHGKLKALIDNQTYGATPITAPATECLDVEAHFVIEWQYA